MSLTAATPTASTGGILNPVAGAAHFSLTREPPADDLADTIERHWIIHWDLRGRPPFTQELLPHPCVNLVFEGDRAGVYGIARVRGRRTIEGRGLAVGTKFRPGAFQPFAVVPMPALVDRALSLPEGLGPAAGSQLVAAVAAGEGIAGRIAAIESFLRDRRPPPDPARELVAVVVAAMLSSPPDVRVDQLAAAHGLSTRSLQRLFRRYVGVGPKWVLRRYRLHEATERIAAGESRDYGALALALGYADQSHFNRDFRALVGSSPARYARACESA
ncbi:MAG: AraC family transcriptional regulator [Solirubrobacteraceae bacterium]